MAIFFLQILRLRFNMRFKKKKSQQIVMYDLNMTNTILDIFSVKYYFPHFTFLFNCSLQNQEQQIGGFATVHLSNLNSNLFLLRPRCNRARCGSKKNSVLTD